MLGSIATAGHFQVDVNNLNQLNMQRSDVFVCKGEVFLIFLNKAF